MRKIAMRLATVACVMVTAGVALAEGGPGNWHYGPSDLWGQSNIQSYVDVMVRKAYSNDAVISGSISVGTNATIGGYATIGGKLVVTGAQTNLAGIVFDPAAASTNGNAMTFTYAAGSDITRLMSFNSEAIACITAEANGAETNVWKIPVRVNNTNYALRLTSW